MNNVTLGNVRQCFDNTAPAQVADVEPAELRSKLLLFTYASKHNPGVRYVRGDRFIRHHDENGIGYTPGLTTDMELTRENAHKLADFFVAYAYGPDAMRVNNHSLDVSPNNVKVVSFATENHARGA
jgi:hypothetical protein